MKRVFLFVVCCLLTAVSSRAMAQPDVQEKIRLLEQQLETLRELKASQDRSLSLREKQCYQVFPSRTFCACLSARLPADVLFEQYLRTVTEETPQSQVLKAARDACAGQMSP